MFQVVHCELRCTPLCLVSHTENPAHAQTGTAALAKKWDLVRLLLNPGRQGGSSEEGNAIPGGSLHVFLMFVRPLLRQQPALLEVIRVQEAHTSQRMLYLDMQRCQTAPSFRHAGERGHEMK